MSDHILCAYTLNANGMGETLKPQNVGSALKAKKLAWVHLDADHPDTMGWLAAKLDYLDPFIVSALMADETRPRMTPINDGALIILRGVNTNSDEDVEDMVSVRLFIDKSRIISLQKRKLRAVLSIEESLKSGRGPIDAGAFISQLVSRLTSRFESVLLELDEHTDDVEEKLLVDADVGLRHDIVAIRKKAIIFRRHMSPQREAISQLRMSDFTWISDLDKRSLQESYNHILRFVEELDAIRERAQIVKDELANMIADRLNKNTYVLSVIAAIFLPLGFLTGLLGINIGGIPGSDNPTAFAVFCGMLILLVTVQIIIFRKLKWF